MTRKIGRLSALMVSGKVQLIDKLAVEIKKSGVTERHLFSDLMKVVFGKFVGLDPRTLSDDLGFSYSTVCRWVTGRSAPHPVLWPQVISWIESSLHKKRDELKALLAA